MKNVKLFEEFISSADIITGLSLVTAFNEFRQNNLNSLSEFKNKTVKVTYGPGSSGIMKNSIIGKIVWVGTTERSESAFAFSIKLSLSRKLNDKKDLEAFNDWFGKKNTITLDKDVTIEKILT